MSDNIKAPANPTLSQKGDCDPSGTVTTAGPAQGADFQANPDIISGGPVIRMEEHVERIQRALGLPEGEIDGMLGKGTSGNVEQQWGDVNDPAVLSMLLENGTITPEVAESIEAIQKEIGRGMFKQHAPLKIEEPVVENCEAEGGGELSGLLHEGSTEPPAIETPATETPTHKSAEAEDAFFGKSEYGAVMRGQDGLYIQGEDGPIAVHEGPAGYSMDSAAGPLYFDISVPDAPADVHSAANNHVGLEGAQTLLHVIDRDAPVGDPSDHMQTMPNIIPDAPADPMDGAQNMPYTVPDEMLNGFDLNSLGIHEASFNGDGATFVANDSSIFERVSDFIGLQVDQFASLFKPDEAQPGVQMADTPNVSTNLDNPFNIA